MCLILLAALLAIAGNVLADDEKLATLQAGSETYTNVTITSVTATDIYFAHSRGFGNAKLKNLGAELQKKFHFNSGKAAEQEKQQAGANALYTKAVLEAKPAARAKPAAEAAPARPTEEEILNHPIHAKSFLNQPAPEIGIEKWLTEPPDINGKFVIVDFWATWCGPCRRSIPELNALRNTFKDRLVVIGLSDEPEEMVRKMTNPVIEYSIAIDTQQRSKTAVGVTGIPHALLIDPQGIVRFEGHPGYLDEASLTKLMAKYSR